MELVSIIVPVYNVEKYLAECLDSILASTYSNIEVIVVDDGSPDNCPRICDEYAQKDPRVKVIHQQNQGLVGARNTGLAHATGRYIGFVDSDDMISPKMYEILLRTMQTTDCDVAACEYTYSEENLDTGDASEQKTCVTFTGIDAQLAVLACAHSVRSKTWAGPNVWNRLYKRDSITQLFRSACLIGEDLFFNWDYSKNSRSMTVISVPLYFYRKNEGSICAEYRKHQGAAEKGISHVRVWENLAQDPAYTDRTLRTYIEARAAYMAHGELWRIYAAGEELTYKEFVNTARQLLHDHFGNVWQDKETYSLRIRGLMGMARYLFPIWAAAAKLHGLYQRRTKI